MFSDNFSNLSSEGDLGGQKITRHGKKVEKKFQQKFQIRGAKRNKKMGGKSHVITFGVFPFKNGTLYRAACKAGLFTD